ncbi:hypothetical protein [Chamaesiphon sp.]|uniref:hypothetical protein n=1 Tax=Chamaesiphon sp. TaxID=2814140 RepID=UPI003593908D
MVNGGWRKVREQGRESFYGGSWLGWQPNPPTNVACFPTGRVTKARQVEHLFKTVNHDIYFLSGKGLASGSPVTLTIDRC